MQISTLLDTNALLTYSLSTAPAPVQVSRSATEPTYAKLTFVISNSGGDVTVDHITFVLPIGDPSQPEGTDLTENSDGIGYSVSDSAWKIGDGTDPGTFVLKPAADTPIVVGDQGIAVELTNIDVSPVVGTSRVSINEEASGGDGNQPQATRTCTLAVAKFPHGFLAGNFTAAAPLVQHGQPAVLSWIGTDAPATTYTMLWGTTSQDVTKVRQWTSPPLTDTTTFMLLVKSEDADEPVTVSFAVTQVVGDPDLVASSLHVLGDARVDGTSSFAGVSLFAREATFAANATFDSDVDFNHLLDFKNPVNFRDLAIAGEATFSDVVKALGGAIDARWGRVEALGAYEPVQPGKPYHATTDGFVVGLVWSSQDTDLTQISVVVDGVKISASGGTMSISLQTVETSSEQSWETAGSLLAPVPTGANWQPAIDFGESPTAFYWVPLGHGSAAAAAAAVAETAASAAPAAVVRPPIEFTPATLLTYAIATEPSPLTAGAPGAVLKLVVSNEGEPAECEDIVLELPLGDGTGDLTPEPAAIQASISTPGWEIVPAASPGTFSARPAQGATTLVDRGVAIVLSGIEVAAEVGTAGVRVLERASRDVEPTTTRIRTLKLTKFP